MRIGVIQRIVSRLLWFAAICQAAPLAIAVIYWESRWWAFAIPLLFAVTGAIAIARLPAARRADKDSLRRREGFLAVTLGWLTLVFVTAVSFYLNGIIRGVCRSLFRIHVRIHDDRGNCHRRHRVITPFRSIHSLVFSLDRRNGYYRTIGCDLTRTRRGRNAAIFRRIQRY